MEFLSIIRIFQIKSGIISLLADKYNCLYTSLVILKYEFDNFSSFTPCISGKIIYDITVTKNKVKNYKTQSSKLS